MVLDEFDRPDWKVMCLLDYVCIRLSLQNQAVGLQAIRPGATATPTKDLMERLDDQA